MRAKRLAAHPRYFYDTQAWLGIELKTLPTKLKSDGIREALFEIRFGATPSPELTVANLLSVAAKFGKGARTESLPQADIPAPIRRHDSNLMFQPTVQVQFDSGRLIRVGE